MNRSLISPPSSSSSRKQQPASTESGRATFASSAVKLLADLGFDGLDIDWEYPEDATQARNFVLLLQATREALNQYSQRLPNKPHFYLSVASPAAPTHFHSLDIAGMDASLDFWNLMAYDYAGSWDKQAGHQANLYTSTTNPSSTPFCTDAAVTFYLTAGVHPRKLLLGMPLYGRAFTGTAGPGTPYASVGPGSLENGVWDYKALPPPAPAQEVYDPAIGAAWSYDPASRTMVSYDTPEVVRQKLEYLQAKGLGGAMWWEASGDSNVTGRGLVNLTVKAFEGLDGLKNVLDYPWSRYANMVAGMPGE